MKITHYVATALLMSACATATAQELFSVNLFAYGRNRVDEWQQESWREVVRVEGTDADPTAGIWETSNWENLNAGSTAATVITGSEGSNATWDITNQRNTAPYWWAGVDPGSGTKVARDTSNDIDSGNATLLDSHTNTTYLNNANANNPQEGFGFKIGDYEIRDIPFDTYDVAIYFGVSQGQDFNGIGNFRYGSDIVRPTDPTNWQNTTLNPEFAIDNSDPQNIINGVGISDANAMQFSLPETFPGTSGEFVPVGVLDEITGDGDVGNYILLDGLTDDTFVFQTWAMDLLTLESLVFRFATPAPVAPRSSPATSTATTSSTEPTTLSTPTALVWMAIQCSPTVAMLVAPLALPTTPCGAPTSATPTHHSLVAVKAPFLSQAPSHY